MIKKDYPSAVITECYQYTETGEYLVYFNAGYYSDIANVNLEENTVGYESVWKQLTNRVNNASTIEGQISAARKAVDYPYNAGLDYCLWCYGSNSSYFKVIKD